MSLRLTSINVIAPASLICRVGVPAAFTVVAIAISAALLGGDWHSQAYADNPTPAATRASQSPDASSKALRRYTLQLLHILSAPDANQWQRYCQAIAHCAAAPTRLDAIGAGNEVSPLDATLIALTMDLCADLDRRLDEARTVGLLVNEPESMHGYTLIVGRFNNYIHLIDHLGRIVHSWQFEQWLPHAKLLDNGNLLVMIRQDDGRRSIAEVDPDGSIVWIYTHSERLHHDFLKMPNGNVLMLARGIKTRQEAVAAGANPSIVPDAGMEYDYLIEVRPTGSEGGDIVWEWSAWDYIAQDFDPTKPNYGAPSDHPELIDINFLVETPHISRQSDAWDWLHINGIDYNPALDQIALSPRQYSELWIIDHSAATEEAVARSSANPDNTPPPRTDVLHSETVDNATKDGALLYRWGNPRAYGHGTHADQRLFWQHHAQWIAPGLPGAGNILVFSNGYELVEDPPLHSSIEEITPPMNGYAYQREPGAAYPPAEPAWTYSAETPTDFYSRIMGSTQRLPNGNTLICDSTSGVVFQVTLDGKQVWKYVYPMAEDTPLKQGGQPAILQGDDVFNNAVYRAYWYAPDHPGLRKYDLTPGDAIELYE